MTRRRAALARHAREYDAVLVLGCDAAAQTIRDCTGPNLCRVIRAMEVEGAARETGPRDRSFHLINPGNSVQVLVGVHRYTLRSYCSHIM